MSLSRTMLDSVVKVNNKYHLQTLLEECTKKYVQEKIKIENYIDEDSNDETKSDIDNDANDE